MCLVSSPELNLNGVPFGIYPRSLLMIFMPSRIVALSWGGWELCREPKHNLGELIRSLKDIGYSSIMKDS